MNKSSYRWLSFTIRLVLTLTAISLTACTNAASFYEVGGEYDSVGRPSDINGQLVFPAKEIDGSWFIEGQGQQAPRYYGIGFVSEVNGKLTYEARLNELKTIVVHNGTEYGREYDKAYFARSINGKLAYKAKKNQKSFIVYDGKIIGKKYDNSSVPIEIAGKLTYSAGPVMKSVIAHGDKEFGATYDRAYSPIDVNNKLAYLAKSKGKTLVVWDGVEYGKEYDKITSPLYSIDGELAYLAAVTEITEVYHRKKYTDKWRFVIGHKEVGIDYDGIGSLTEIDGKFAYHATKKGKSFIVYDGERYGEEYGDCFNPFDSSGRLTYQIRKDGYQHVVLDGVLGKPYKKITGLTTVAGKLAYRAKLSADKWVIVIER